MSAKSTDEELEKHLQEFKKNEECYRLIMNNSSKMEAMGTLAGGIAHEFNNLFGIILANTELAMEDVPTGNPASDCLQAIRNTVLRAKFVVRQIVSFSHNTPTIRKPIQISIIIRETMKLIRATIPTRITIHQEIQCDSEWICANPTEIDQVLVNLCNNSAHAMDQDSGTLHVCLETVVLDEHSVTQYNGLTVGKYVKLTVSDTGKGIAPEIMDRVFDPYFTTKEVGQGLGMGLAVVYGIVKKHEGAINIFSKVGEETIVEVLFPVIKAGAEDEFTKDNKKLSGNARILLVDDEPYLVKIQKRILEKHGYSVIGETDSFEALRIFKRQSDSIDLIITDMAMPGLTGDRLIQETKKIRPDIPIILCTGQSYGSGSDIVKKLGVSQYVMKPIEKIKLIQIVRDVLDKAKS
ncbi:MAG: response regulator [Pseudomonadota bacterium]